MVFETHITTTKKDKRSGLQKSEDFGEECPRVPDKLCWIPEPASGNWGWFRRRWRRRDASCVMAEFKASLSVVMWKVEGLSNTPLVYLGKFTNELLKMTPNLFLVLMPKYKRMQTC